MISCPPQRCPKNIAQGTSLLDNKSLRCCCCNSRPTMINHDYNMTKQFRIKRIYHEIHSTKSSDIAYLPPLWCTHLSLTTGVVALHIPSWRPGIILCMRPANERRCYIVTSSLIGWAHSQNDPWKGHVKLSGELVLEEHFVAIKIIYMESPITIDIYEAGFWKYKPNA